MTRAREARKHDKRQAERRTDAQNRKIIELARKHGLPGDMWYYSDIAKTGDPVTLGVVGGHQWTISAGGVVTDDS